MKKKIALLRTFYDYKKRPVILTRQTWTNHILKFHPEMLGRLNDIAPTLQKPEALYQQSIKKRVDLLYFKCLYPRAINKYLKVAVEIKGSKYFKFLKANIKDPFYGRIKSVFPVANILGGGKKLL